jgi:hypothetical protein
MKTCEWKYNEDYDCYDTDCGNSFSLDNGTPKENCMKYCPYCGKEIYVIASE